MIYKVLQSNNLHDLENQVMQKMNEGYTLQGGVGLLQISNIIGESKISSNTNAAATMTVEILYTQAVIRQ